MFVALLAMAVCGGQPVRYCPTAYGYRQQHQVNYGYSQGYQAQSYLDGVAYYTYEPTYSKLVGGAARTDARNQDSQELAKQVGLLASQVGQLRTQLAAGSAPPAPGSGPVPPAPPAPGPIPPAPVVPAPLTSDLANGAAVIIVKKCTPCHQGASKAGNGFQMLDDRGALTTILPLKKLQIEQKCYSGEMPPDPKKALTGEEYSALRAWINEDKDAIEAALKLCEENTK